MSKFNLDKAITEWKSRLHHFKGFEDGDIEEFEDHLRAHVEELVQEGYSEAKAFEKIMQQEWSELPRISKAFKEARNSSGSMARSLLINFLKVSFRSFRKRWNYTSINILGLIIGLTSVFGISIYLINEISYDKFHENGSTIYRTVNLFKKASGQIHMPLAPPAVAPTIGTSLAGIKRVTRMRHSGDILIRNGDQQFTESRGFYADSSFLRMFTFPLEIGDLNSALSEPNSILMTRELAKKYFQDEDPMGKMLIMNGEHPLKVTGILKEVPKNSHIDFEFLISFESYIVPDGYLADLTSWGWMGFLTYFQLDENANVSELEDDLTAAYKSYNTSTIYTDIVVTLQPLHDIYLHSAALRNPNGGMFASNNASTLWGLLAVALLTLFIASFNYLNITIASFQTRIKEMGVRQVMGSGKSKIMMQLITESFLVVCIAGLISLIIAYLGLQFDWGGFDIGLAITPRAVLVALIGLILLSLLLGLIVGIGTGSTLINSKMLELLKGVGAMPSNNGRLKNSMLFVQYLISAGLILSSIIIARQVNYMNQKELGFEAEGVIALSGIREHIMESFDRFRYRMETNPSIVATSLANHAFEGGASGNSMRLTTWSEDNAMQIAYYQVGYEFSDVMGLELLEGRFFSKDISTDSTHGVVINETAARTLGINQITNQKVHFTADEEMEVIGIVKDFHFQSLHHEISPMALIMPFVNVKYILVKFQTNDLPALVAEIEENWNEANNQRSELEMNFLDDLLYDQYQKDHLFSGLIKLFTALAIFLASLGLWGLTSIAINQRIKQISIRKVLGASPLDLIFNIGRVSLIVAIVASLISWPLIRIVSLYWLENFAYHIEPHFTMFLQSLVIVGSICIVTLSSQYLKIRKTDPAKILQNDG